MVVEMAPEAVRHLMMGQAKATKPPMTVVGMAEMTPPLTIVGMAEMTPPLTIAGMAEIVLPLTIERYLFPFFKQISGSRNNSSTLHTRFRIHAL